MNWLKYTKLYYAVSLIMIAVSIFALVSWRLPVGVDFTGGTLLEYSFSKDVSTENLQNAISENGIETQAVQVVDGSTYLLRLAPITPEQRIELNELIKDEFDENAQELRFEVVGPSIGQELVKKTFYAIAISALAILLWIAYQFKSVKFGLAAILAMFHDTFILVGSFALFGHLLDAQVDFLFVTAVLTTLSFSVHDTIVVFDRIREINRIEGGEIYEVSNKALTETMVRSLNNSFTIMFMLLALVFLGGTTIRWFAVALLVGTVLGTYSSPFVAVPLLNIFDRFKNN